MKIEQLASGDKPPSVEWAKPSEIKVGDVLEHSFGMRHSVGGFPSGSMSEKSPIRYWRVIKTELKNRRRHITVEAIVVPKTHEKYSRFIHEGWSLDYQVEPHTFTSIVSVGKYNNFTRVKTP